MADESDKVDDHRKDEDAPPTSRAEDATAGSKSGGVNASTGTSQKSSWQAFTEEPMFPYVAPFFLFMAFLILEGSFTHAVYVFYPLKALCVGVLLLYLWPRFPDFGKLNWGGSIFVGTVGFVLWVGLDPFLVHRTIEQQADGFNPYLFNRTDWGEQMGYALIFFRVLGAVAVVPVMEELFWRGFLMRYLVPSEETLKRKPVGSDDPIGRLDYLIERHTNEQFEDVAMGTFRWFSFLATTLLFASVHGGQWPLAFIYGTLIGWYFVRTKSLWNATMAHAVTNLLLAVYVIYTERWYFW